MTNPIIVIRILIALLITCCRAYSFSQEPLTVSISNSTVLHDCQNGRVDLSINGGFSPYDITWYDSNGEIVKQVFDISGENNEEDLRSVPEGLYSVEATDALCGKASTELYIECDCITDLNYSQMNNCNEGEENGTIVFINNDYNFNWDPDVPTGQFLGDNFHYAHSLPNGRYCVTVTRNFTECSSERCFEITTSDPIEFTNVNIQGVCPNGDLGGISFDIYNGEREHNWSGYWPIQISWDDTDEFNRTNERQDLFPDVYSATISDGCSSASMDFEVGWDCECPEFNDVQHIIAYACSDAGNEGQITILSHREELFGIPFFDFTWSGDHTFKTSPDGRTITNLRPGNYSVTISHRFSDCEVIKNFFVGIEKPIELSFQEITKSCRNQPTGRIEIEYTGGSNTDGVSYPGVVVWDDIPTGRLVRENLEAGVYCVAISSNCYKDRRFCFTVTDYDLSVTLLPSYSPNTCDQHEIEVEVDGENPPFLYNWSNGSIKDKAVNLGFDTYTLTVTDALGCTAEESIELFPIEITETIDACANINDGSVKIEIDNPNNLITDVYFEVGAPCNDCGNGQWPMTIGDNSNPILIELDELAGNEQYYLNILQQTASGEICNYQFPFFIGEEDFTRTYSSHNPLMVDGVEIDHIYECIYDIVCRDTEIQNGVVEPSRFEINESCDDSKDFWGTIATNINPFGNSLDCGSADVFCFDELIETFDIDAEKIRQGEHDELLQRHGESYGSMNWEIDLCAQVFVCPQDPFCFQNGWGGNVFHGDHVGNVRLDNGCIVVKCRLALFFSNNYTICGLDFLPEHWNLYTQGSIFNINININDEETIEEHGFFGSCEQRSFNLFGLWTNRERYEEMEEFEGSELEAYLSEENLEEYLDAMKCAEIVICLNDFSVHTIPDLENSDCEVFDIDDRPNFSGVGEFFHSCESIEGQMNGTPGLWVACNSDNPQPTFISLDADDYITGLHDDCGQNSEEVQFVTSKSENTLFSTFGFSTDGFGRNYPNGIYKGTRSESRYYHHLRERIYEYTYSWNILYSFELSKEGYGNYIIGDSIQSNRFQLLSGDPTSFVDNVLHSGNTLELNNYSFYGEEDYLLKGSYEGGLSINSQLLSGTIDEGDFMMEIKKDGSFGQRHFVNSDNFLSEPSKHSNSLFYNVISNDQLINVDGVSYSFDAGTILEAEMKSTGLEINSDVKATGTLELLSTEYNSDKSRKYYLFRGTGDLYYKNYKRFGTSEEKVILFEIDDNGNYQGSKYIDIPNINSVVPNIEIDEKGNIYIAFNVGDDPSVSNENLPSPTGGNDIIIVELNSSKIITETYHYETVSRETVKDIFYSNKVLFFGGEIEGNNTFERKIGDMTFYAFSDNTKLGYVSYINLRENAGEPIDCNLDCEEFINFIPNVCGASLEVSGQDVDNYFLIIEGDNGYYNEVGFLSVESYYYNFEEEGVYTFYLKAANEPCKDLEYLVVVENGCNHLEDLCNSINTSASGNSDWFASFVSDGYGLLTIIFNSATVPDQLIVRKNGAIVVDSSPYSRNFTQSQVDSSYPACNAIGGSGQDFIAEIFVGENDNIDVEVLADNCGIGNTVWYLDAECSGSSNIGSIRINTREREVEDDYLIENKRVLTVRPNPVTNILNIESNFKSTFSLEIYNSSGELVSKGLVTESIHSLDVSSYAAGVYLIMVNNSQESIIQRFIKL